MIETEGGSEVGASTMSLVNLAVKFFSSHRARVAQRLLSATKLDKSVLWEWGISLAAWSHLHNPLPQLGDHCWSTTKGHDRDILLKGWKAFYCWKLNSRSSFSFDKSIAVSYRRFRAELLHKSTTCCTPNSDLGRYKHKESISRSFVWTVAVCKCWL